MNTQPYQAPSFLSSSHNCPYCGALAQMTWIRLEQKISHPTEHHIPTPFYCSECLACSRRAVWQTLGKSMGNMIWPANSTAPLAHADMPSSCRDDYEEARQISRTSPRGAAALLRLCVQKICKELGQPGKDINVDIGALVKQGLPARVQQALDTVRVIGNEAVHPGTMSSDDHAERVDALFKLVNMIVDQMIAQPKEVASLFASLPAAKLDGISIRDQPKP
ncbi:MULTISPECIES: DUF4145 domain-containing protein [Achromobacter]|uniref:DUF4145 domain-containing protein n=1 Tax=Achromobacter TaxID=222 RepID=UPI0007BF3B9C|nr:MULTISPECIES: DUF4145 domain-containing protein [Achromobacter]MEC6413529.1 DUF4145 domain-containing protein [Achromobacter xylosoxidans]